MLGGNHQEKNSNIIWILWMIEPPRWAAFVFTEELIKTIFVQKNRAHLQRLSNTVGTDIGESGRAQAFSAACGALGYATAQSVFIVVLVTLLEERITGDEDFGEITSSEFAFILFSAVFFAFLIIPLNMAASFLIGVQIANLQGGGGTLSNWSFLKILKKPVIIRTLGFCAFLIPIETIGLGLKSFKIALCVSFILVICVWKWAYRVVSQTEKRLPFQEDIVRSLYESLLGYDVVGEVVRETNDVQQDTVVDLAVPGDEGSPEITLDDEDAESILTKENKD
eukprot:g4559.t1